MLATHIENTVRDNLDTAPEGREQSSNGKGGMGHSVLLVTKAKTVVTVGFAQHGNLVCAGDAAAWKLGPRALWFYKMFLLASCRGYY